MSPNDHLSYSLCFRPATELITPVSELITPSLEIKHRSIRQISHALPLRTERRARADDIPGARTHMRRTSGYNAGGGAVYGDHNDGESRGARVEPRRVLTLAQAACRLVPRALAFSRLGVKTFFLAMEDGVRSESVILLFPMFRVLSFYAERISLCDF